MMRFLSKVHRMVALLLTFIALVTIVTPTMASVSRVTFDGYVGRTDTYSIITVDSTDLSISELGISDYDNCGIISKLRFDYTVEDGKTIFSLTVLPNSPGTASFKCSYTYIENGKTYSNTVQVTMNITGPMPKPNLPTVSISAGIQNEATGVCKLTATFSGCTQYGYQWYYNTQNSTSSAVPVGNQETTRDDTVTIEVFFDGKTEAYYYWFIKVWNPQGGSAVYSKSVRLMNPYSPENITPTPTATPKTGKDLPIITKHPSNETVSAGSAAAFIARADNCAEYQWTFVNASGREYTPAQAKSKLSGLKYTGDTTEKLKLSNIPTSMDGWSVYCTFTNENGSRDSKKAYITVKYEEGDELEVIPKTGDDTPLAPMAALLLLAGIALFFIRSRNT